MVSLKLSVIFWGLLVLISQFHSGYSFFLGVKKELLKEKLWKVKAALLDDHHGYEEVHHVHYKPYYVSSGYGYGKLPSYSSFGSYPYKGWY